MRGVPGEESRHCSGALRSSLWLRNLLANHANDKWRRFGSLSNVPGSDDVHHSHLPKLSQVKLRSGPQGFLVLSGRQLLLDMQQAELLHVCLSVAELHVCCEAQPPELGTWERRAAD
mmetsp:Transcript_62884/g.132751  ORF Transcript_62884/g.132751 Transcript_62884/m.132751 type:complete len:117 (+) Transcript_62884:387-737(+)